jgi:hypothetical protein
MDELDELVLHAETESRMRIRVSKRVLQRKRRERAVRLLSVPRISEDCNDIYLSIWPEGRSRASS